MRNDDRAAYVRGLRVLADALEQNPELPLPYQGTGAPITFNYLHLPEPVAEMTAAMRAIPCDFTAGIVTYAEGDQNAYLYLHGTLHGVMVQLVAYRKDACRQDENGEWHIPDVFTPAQPEGDAGEGEQS